MSEAKPSKKERVFQGLGVAPGIAHAPVVIHWEEESDIPERAISDEEIADEISRFEAALIDTRAELLEMQQKIADAIGAHDAGIFDAHLMVVEDRTLIEEVLKSLSERKVCVERIFADVAETYCTSLAQIEDPYLQERVIDIQDVAKRVLRHLAGLGPHGLATSGSPHVLASRLLTPSDTASLDRSKVLGFASEVGSRTSHAAIMARSLGIPAVTGLQNIFEVLETGDDVVLDGTRGLLILNPSEQTLAEYGKIEQRREQVEKELDQIRDTESRTLDGTRIVLSANIELPNEMDAVVEHGAEGIGLFRTEFLFLNREEAPGEDEQFEVYRQVAERAAPHPVIIRSLDVGGDKLSQYIAHMDEENPFLGCRGIRYCLEHPEVFRPQLRAILRASAFGPVRLMYPMISGIDELGYANATLHSCKDELRAEGIPFNEHMAVGIMIEVPSAALVADQLGREVAFFSIGTNDLIQYTIAVDRVNDRISYLYDPCHPSILRLIKMVVEAARQNGIWVGVCGEMAGDIAYTPLLLGLGVTELSATSRLVPRVKHAVQHLSIENCRKLAEEVLPASDSNWVLDRTISMAKTHYPELFE